MELPKRKRIRLGNYDYSTPGAYFITVCVADRKPLLWRVHTTSVCSYELSEVGKTVDAAIRQIPERYENVAVDNYCIMPDHIHMILTIRSGQNGRQVAAPTIPILVGQMKRWVSREIGYSLWQRSFIDHVIRNEQVYREMWEYIDNNPRKIIDAP